MSKSKILMHSTVVAIATFALGVSVASSSTNIRFAWATADSETDPYAIFAHAFQAELDRLAPGEFTLEFFPRMALGTEVETLRQMQVGAVDAGVITGAQVGSMLPAYQLNDLPFLYTDQAHVERVLDGPVGEDLLGQLESEGLIGLGFAVAGFRHVINNTRPILEPDDLRGVQLRVQPTDIYLDMFEALGASPVPMEWTDTYMAVQQGTLDGLELPLPVIYANNVQDITRYLSLTQHTFNAMPVVFSATTFNRLDADSQNVLREAARAAIEIQRAQVAENNTRLVDTLHDAGMEVSEVNDLSSFQDRAQSVYDEYRDRIGGNLIDQVMADAE